MPSAEPEASNVTARREPVRKKPRISANSSRNNTPNAYSRRSPPRDPAPIADNEDEGDRSPPRKLKRPGAGARIGAAHREAVEAARKRREEEERRAVADRQTNSAHLVADHYNAVPERGREWRKTDSQIKGLRSLNNWVKSTLIQKFSRPPPDAGPVAQLCVLDMACGKGGDLGKWEKAPQVPALYVGCDIADISVEQARSRWEETVRKSHGKHRRPVTMQAEFYVQDSFGRPVGDIARVREVGFNPNIGPGGPVVIQGGMMSGGFDVVSMMFALHYSYENETLARGMLKNVAGALKKGGRFIGVMPNSDVISAMVKKLLVAEAGGKSVEKEVKKVKEGEEEGEIEEDYGDWDPEKPSEPNGTTNVADDEDEWDPEKPSDPQPLTTNGPPENADDDDDWDPEKPSEAAATATLDEPGSASIHQNQLSNGATPASEHQTPAQNLHLPPLEWGNSLYTVRFPRQQPLVDNKPLPTDGIFRPPYGWKYHYYLAEAVENVPEYVVPWTGFRALAEEYGLELMYKKGFREVLDEILLDDSGDSRELMMLAERMGVLSRDRSEGKRGLLVGEEELEAAGFYLAFCFYKT